LVPVRGCLGLRVDPGDAVVGVASHRRWQRYDSSHAWFFQQQIPWRQRQSRHEDRNTCRRL
jgi:hypothetical protein